MKEKLFKLLMTCCILFLGMTSSSAQIDCDCDFILDPVCVATPEGDTIPFPNACIAACEGFEEGSIVDCPDNGGWPGDDCDCELDGEPVCVLTDEDLICIFPNMCFAECAGYTDEDVVECEDGTIDPPIEDCDCEFVIDPVCVEADGEILTFPNACVAECFGFGEDSFVDCGIDEPGGGCDCDWELDPVCVVTVEGDTIPFPNACIAECEGFGEDSIVDCPDNGGWPGDDCDCELDGEPVCVLTDEDLICVFPNMCFAECAGYTDEDVVECEDGTIDPPIEDCDCEFVIDPVCVEADGEILTFPNACVAECFGFGEDSFVDCGIDEPGGDCDCGWEFDPVCVVTVEGDTIPFPNACIAECEGFGEDSIVDCPDNGGWPGDDCDCELDGEPVCVLTDEDLICVFPNMCFAECEGYTDEDVVECEDDIPGGGCDCTFEFDPVCVTLDNGEIIEFPNACWAECEGYTENDFVDCVLEPGIPDCDCGFEGEEVCIVIEEIILVFPNICWAECVGFTEGDIVDCDGFTGDEPDELEELLQAVVNETGFAGNNLPELIHEYINTQTLRVEEASIYPNPINGNKLTIEVNALEAGDANIHIVSITGQVVQVSQVHLVKGKQQLEVDASNLINGVYLSRIETAKSTHTLKFIKQ